jgi:ABC-2 type transport system ATP-binding protein
METEWAIDISDLAHTYTQGSRKTAALRGVNLRVRRNEIFALLGPNGAGKTTLLSALEGLLQPARGTVRIAGLPVDAGKRLLGIQLQRTALLENLTARELIELYAGLYGVYLSRAQIDALLAQFDLREQADKLTRRMSGGQQQRLALALAVANNPQIVLLDEPTESLDPHARRAIWSIIRHLREQGRTVLFTTHQMEEAEALCERVAILDRGQLVACDTPARLVNGLGAHPVLRAAVELPIDRVRGLTGVLRAGYNGANLEIETAQLQDTLAALYGLATAHGRIVNDVAVRQPNLEDVYLKLTGKPLAAAAA